MSKDKKLIPELRFPEFLNAREWDVELLGELVDIKGRIGYRGYTTDDIVKKGEGAITLSPSNFDENGNLNFDKCTYISWRKYEESPEIQLQIGQTVLVKTASVGKTAYVKHLPEKATVNPQIVVLTPKKIQNRFLAFTILHQNIQNQIRDCVGAGAIPNLSQESISKFKALIPPDKERKEQQKIASCLSSLDEVISAHSQKLECLHAHKKGLMQNLFPQKDEKVPRYRFPEFVKDGEWGEKTLGQLLEFKNGINAEKEQYGTGTKFINVLDILRNEFITYDQIIGAVNVNDEMVEKFAVNYGDILFQRSSETQDEVGTANVYLDRNRTAIFGGFVIRGKKVGEYEPIFLNKLLKSKSVRHSISSKSGGSTRFNIGQEILSSIKILLPSIQEQQKIASCLSSLDALIRAQAEKMEQLKLHKKGLMQGLFPKTIE